MNPNNIRRRANNEPRGTWLRSWSSPFFAGKEKDKSSFVASLWELPNETSISLVVSRETESINSAIFRMRFLNSNAALVPSWKVEAKVYT